MKKWINSIIQLRWFINVCSIYIPEVDSATRQHLLLADGGGGLLAGDPGFREESPPLRRPARHGRTWFTFLERNRNFPHGQDSETKCPIVILKVPISATIWTMTQVLYSNGLHFGDHMTNYTTTSVHLVSISATIWTITLVLLFKKMNMSDHTSAKNLPLKIANSGPEPSSSCHASCCYSCHYS